MRTLSDLYQEYVVDLDPVLWEMGRVNGVLVNNEKRLSLLSDMRVKLKGIQDNAQELIPDTLFPLQRLKTEPTPIQLEKKSARGVRPVEVPNEKVKTCSHCGLQHVTKGDHTARKGGKGDVPLNECYKAEIVLAPGIDTAYDVVLPFNPRSDDQMKAYADLFHHKLGRNWKTGQDTLDAKQILKFIDKYGDKHPLYKLAYDGRKIGKAKGYAQAWIPDSKGLIYGTFTHAPETFRLSQKEHNFMNVSHRGDVPYVEELRELLEPPPGYVQLEADSSSVEAVISGYFMGSTLYQDIARKGVHAWWAAKKLGMEFTPANVKLIKNPDDNAEFWATQGKLPVEIQILYETKKRTVHGVSYGMGAKLLHESYPEFFPAIYVVENGKRKLCPTCSAQAEIDEFYTLVPDLKAWHTDTQKWAHKHGYLQSPWGFRNYYYRVFVYDWKTKTYKLGDDAKAAIAFQPQHANGMFQRGNLVRIHKTLDKMGKKGVWWQPANGHVHDSNGLMVPEDDVDRAAEMLGEIMNRPIKELGNLQVGVQVKAGRNWAKMKPVLTVN